MLTLWEMRSCIYCKMSISRQSLCYQNGIFMVPFKWISIKEKLLIDSLTDNKHQKLYINKKSFSIP